MGRKIMKRTRQLQAKRISNQNKGKDQKDATEEHAKHQEVDVSQQLEKPEADIPNKREK